MISLIDNSDIIADLKRKVISFKYRGCYKHVLSTYYMLGIIPYICDNSFNFLNSLQGDYHY